MKKILFIFSTILLCSSMLYSATINVPGDYATIQLAVAAASNGDVIQVAAGTITETTLTLVDKANLTIQGMGSGSTIVQVSGTGYRFQITGSGVTIKDLHILKTDKVGVQDIILIQANNFSLLNCIVSGQYVFGDGDVSRAMATSGGYSGLLIDGNTFYSLRQPGYISGVITGTISNNYIYGTKGWVVEQGDLTFINNTWGTNVYDIAILSGVSPIYYTDIAAMSNANNNAVIEDQRVVPAVLSVVYVDASTSVLVQRKMEFLVS